MDKEICWVFIFVKMGIFLSFYSVSADFFLCCKQVYPIASLYIETKNYKRWKLEKKRSSLLEFLLCQSSSCTCVTFWRLELWIWSFCSPHSRDHFPHSKFTPKSQGVSNPVYLHKQSPTQLLWQKQLNLSCFVSTWFLLSLWLFACLWTIEAGEWQQIVGMHLNETNYYMLTAFTMADLKELGSFI